MDLSERRGAPVTRHPWETSRATAITNIARRLSMSGARVLDVGCGDGYLARELQERIGFREVVAQDIHLTGEMAAALSGPLIRFVRLLDGLEYRADLILLLDVLEHLDDPRAALQELAQERLAPNGRMLITVPAFQSLFTSHDIALKHVRRYSRRQLEAEVTRAGLTVLESGYLFASLLVPRSLTAIRERLIPRPTPPSRSHGVGEWRAPGIVTRAIHAALTVDNALCLTASSIGLTLPGLSVWLTCKAPQ